MVLPWNLLKVRWIKNEYEKIMFLISYIFCGLRLIEKELRECGQFEKQIDAVKHTVTQETTFQFENKYSHCKTKLSRICWLQHQKNNSRQVSIQGNNA